MIELLPAITKSLFHVAAGTQAVQCPGGVVCDTGLPVVGATSSNLQAALQIVFGIIGVAAVIVVVFGGFQFVTAQGDTQKVAQARKTVLYAVIGLGVAVSAEVIVTFVLDKL